MYPGIRHCLVTTRGGDDKIEIYIWGEILDPEVDNGKKHSIIKEPKVIL